MQHKDELLTKKEQQQIFRRLLSYAKAHIKPLTLAFLLLLVATGADLLGPILVQKFIDDYLTPRNFPAEPLLWLGTLYLVLHLSAVLMNYLQAVMFQRIALKIIQRIRIDVMSNVERLGLSFFLIERQRGDSYQE